MRTHAINILFTKKLIIISPYYYICNKRDVLCSYENIAHKIRKNMPIECSIDTKYCKSA